MGRTFWLFLLSQSINLVGDTLGHVAMAWLVYDLTGSKIAMGTLYLVGVLPETVVRLFGAPLVDRVNRPRLMALLDAAQSLAYLAPVLLHGHLGMWHLFVLNGIAGAARALYLPAYQATIPSLVAPDQLTRANAIVQGVMSGSRIVGPAVAGIVVSLFGPYLALGLDGVSFALSCLALLRLPDLFGAARAASARTEPYLKRLIDGFRFFRTVPALLTLMPMVTAGNMGAVAVNVLMVPFVRDHLGGDARMVGAFVSALSVGFLGGTILMTLRGDPRHRRYTMLGAVVLTGAAMSALGAVGRGQYILALTAWGLSGLGGAVFNANTNAVYHRMVPDKLRGRVAAVRLLVGTAATPLGAFLGSTMAETVGLRTTLLATGLLPVAMGVVGLFLPWLRSLDDAPVSRAV